MNHYDVVILGAGPYGLSAAAHLRAVAGLDVKVFGSAMSFWQQHMPEGMLLRSPYPASHLSDPTGTLSLDTYQVENRLELGRRVPLDRFVDYGLWFQRKAVPEIDPRKIKCIDREGGDFRLLLDDEEQLRTRLMVIAGGIGPFHVIPSPFRNLPKELAFHASQERNLGRFAGKKVAVVGAGQSALESAAILHESGADVEVLVRKQDIIWLTRSHHLHHLGFLSQLLYAPSDVGPMGASRLIAVPNWFRRIPRGMQDKFRRHAMRPAGSSWLVPRFEKIKISKSCSIASAVTSGEQVRLRFEDGNERVVDHVLLGTGYRVDISRYPFLSQNLLASIQCVQGFPVLDFNFEASVPGLHFIGATAARSYGPLLSFVAGTDFASRTLARHIARNGKK